jgi:hypothetical protein
MRPTDAPIDGSSTSRSDDDLQYVAAKDIHASPGELISALSSHEPNVCCRPSVAAWNSVTGSAVCVAAGAVVAVVDEAWPPCPAAGLPATGGGP